MATIRAGGFVLLLAAVFVGCNEAPPPSPSTVDEQIEYVPPGPEFKLSREAAGQRQQVDFVAEADSEESENATAEPRRKTVIESLFQAVRHGTAEAMDEGAGKY